MFLFCCNHSTVFYKSNLNMYIRYDMDILLLVSCCIHKTTTKNDTFNINKLHLQRHAFLL